MSPYSLAAMSELTEGQIEFRLLFGVEKIGRRPGANLGTDRHHAPGLVVQICYSDGRPPPPAPMIDVTPERDALEPPA